MVVQQERYPTSLFTIFEPGDQEVGEMYLVQERSAMDFDAPKLWKGRSGSSCHGIARSCQRAGIQIGVQLMNTDFLTAATGEKWVKRLFDPNM